VTVPHDATAAGDDARLARRGAYPVLDVPHLADDPRAIALVLHGGRERSHQRVPARRLAVVRMRPIARAIAEASPSVIVATLRYRFRGWNGTAADPVADVEWALRELDDRFQRPIVLVGHSMGGRAALRCGGHASVAAVCALAPWLPDGEPSEQLAGRNVLIMHGSRDRTTSRRASEAFARSLIGLARPVTYLGIAGSGHAMLQRTAEWNGLTSQFVESAADGLPLPAELAAGELTDPAAPIVWR
jgi:pimeloyl-ACP methyl ester carboxylesterase